MTIARIILCSLLALGPAIAAQAELAPPPAVQQAIAEARKDCEPERATLLPGFVAEKDVNGDGRKDFVLDYGKFQCGDSTMYYCGTGGCLMQVFVSRPDGTAVKALDENVRALKFAKVKRKPAMILELHGSACGKTGADRCAATRVWNGSEFVGTR